MAAGVVATDAPQGQAWHEALLLVLETVKHQAAQIKRLEDVLAQPPAAQQQQQQHDAAAADGGTALLARLQHLEGRVQQLERLAQPPPAPRDVRHTAAARSQQQPACSSSSDMPLWRLEQQVACLAESTSDMQARLHASVSDGQQLQQQLQQQLDTAVDNVRTDAMQAIALATHQMRAAVDAAAAAAQRQRDLAAQQLQALSDRVDSQHVAEMASLQQQLSDMQATTQAGLRGLQQQLEGLQEQHRQPPLGLLASYTQQVSELFEQLTVGLAQDSRAGIARLDIQQQALAARVDELAAASSSLRQHQQQCVQQYQQLQQGLNTARVTADAAAAAAAGSAQQAGEALQLLQLQLADTQGAVEALGASVAALEAAGASSSGVLQQHGGQLQQVAAGLHALQQQLLCLANAVDPSEAAVLAAVADGGAAAAAAAAAGSSDLQVQEGSTCHTCGRSPASLGSSRGSGAAVWQLHRGAGSEPTGSGAGSSSAGTLRELPLAMRLLCLERDMQDVSSSMADVRAVRGDVAALATQLQVLSAEADATSTLQRGVDGVAARLQQLEQQAADLACVTDRLSAQLSERPSVRTVDGLVCAARTDAVAAANGALHSALQPLQAQLAGVQDSCNQAQQQVACLEEWCKRELHQHTQQLGQLRLHADELEHQLGSSCQAAEEAVQHLTASQGKLADRLAALETAGAMHASSCAASGRQLQQQMTAAEQAAADRLAGLAAAVAQAAAAVQELRTSAAACAARHAQGNDALLGAAVRAAEARLVQHESQEEGRWEVWLAEFAQALQQRPTLEQLQQLQARTLQAACKAARHAARQAVTAAAAAGTGGDAAAGTGGDAAVGPGGDAAPAAVGDDA